MYVEGGLFDAGGGPTMFAMDAAYIAHYQAKMTSAEEHTMIECMSVLKNMPVDGVQYGLAAKRLISGKD
ncbi:hypothetical protein LguiA_001154 [Lonicera macranthoides]